MKYFKMMPAVVFPVLALYVAYFHSSTASLFNVLLWVTWLGSLRAIIVGAAGIQGKSTVKPVSNLLVVVLGFSQSVTTWYAILLASMGWFTTATVVFTSVLISVYYTLTTIKAEPEDDEAVKNAADILAAIHSMRETVGKAKVDSLEEVADKMEDEIKGMKR